MRVWDAGDYELLLGESILDAIDQGEVKIVLNGKRLRGEWHIVNTRKDEWLLFKANDVYAREVEHLVPPSVDLTALEEHVVVSNPRRAGRMRPASSVAPFDDPDWIFELDFSGIPVLVSAGSEPSIKTTRGKELIGSLPDLASSLETFRSRHAAADGVLVAGSSNSLPTAESAKSALEANAADLVLYLYDLTEWDRFSTREMNVVGRKEILRSIIPDSESVQYIDHVNGRAKRLAAEAARLGLSWLVAKDSTSTYREGSSNQWKRVDCLRGQQDLTDRKVKFTNRSKIFWPGTDMTKGDLIDYYDFIADMLLPQLIGRPVHMLRYPNGIEGKYFYQRHVPEHSPTWIETVEYGEGDERERFIVCANRETILHLVNLGSIDLHPWMSTASAPDFPTFSIIDIDAKQADFAGAVKAARAIGKVLSGIEADSYLKTSGGTGLHVVIPIEPIYTYEQSRMFAEAVCRVVAMQYSDSFTVERNPKQRGRRVYLDYLQNAKGQTVVAPYVVRPREGAPVSMPLQWDELASQILPLDFNLRTALDRIEQTGDLFRGVVGNHQKLEQAISNLESYFQSM